MSSCRRAVFLSLAFLISFSLFSGGNSEERESYDRTIYFVSILPQAYLLERIGGDRIDVSVMVPPGKSPATYEPTPRQVIELGEAELFFTLDVPFEQNFLPNLKSSLPDLPLVNAAEGIEKRHLETHHHDEDEHEDDHDEGALDPHVWLSPILAKTIAQNMADALIESDPEGKALYEDNLTSLLIDLEALDKELTDILAPLKGETLFVYHPAFGYFADRYGMEQEAIELGGKEPTPAELEEIIHHAQEEQVHIILVQPEFSQASAKAVADAIGGAVVPVATLSGDYINNMKVLANQLREGLE